MSPSLQVKLLRTIEHREVTPVGDARPRFTDIRVIAATNRDMRQEIRSGRFRADLYHRLSVFTLNVPPQACAIMSNARFFSYGLPSPKPFT